MVGEHVSLYAYSRGWAARDLPYQLWRMIEDANDWSQLIWEDDVKDTRVSKFGDLTHWMAFMEDKMWLLIVDNATQVICGLGWFSDRRGSTALSSIWMAPQWRGKPHSREAIKLGIEFGYQELNLTTIQSITPWPIARNLCVKCGYRVIAFIPKHFGHDVWFLEHTRNN